MRDLLEELPGAQLPDTERQSEAPGVPIRAPDEFDLIRPVGEEALSGRGQSHTSPLAKHLSVSFGPVHPALDEPMMLRLQLDGDRIVHAETELGFLHQGLEKRAAQIDLQANDGPAALIHVVRRANALAPAPLEIATALAIEQALGCPAPAAEVTLWRTIALELTRIEAHLHVVTHPGLSFRQRQNDRRLAEALRHATGLLDGIAHGDTFAHIHVLGRDLFEDERHRISRGLDTITQAAARALELLDEVSTLDHHLLGLGRIERAAALSFGLTGPTLRATGLGFDLRKHAPQLAYGQLPIIPVTDTTGCARARVRVRLAEVVQSATLIERLFNKLVQPGQTPPAPTPTAPARGVQTFAAALEAPSGQVRVTLVADGGRLLRVRIQTASRALCGALGHALVGTRLEDALTAVASLGICMSEVDR